MPGATPLLPRWARRLAGGVLGLALLLVLAVWSVPALLAWQLPLRLGQALGRPVSVQSVDFSPWRLALDLQGLQIGAAGPGQPPLQVARLQATLGWASLRHRAPVVQALTIDGLRLNLARTAPGRYDIDDLIARFGAPAPARGADEPARFALHNLALRDAQIRFDDRPAGQVHTLQAITLTLPFLSNLPADVATHTAPRLAFTLNGTRFDSGSQLLPFAATRSGELGLSFDNLDLQPWRGYLPASLPLRLQQAHVSADLTLRFALPPEGPPSVALRGRVGLRDVALRQPDGAPLLAWQSLQLGLRDLQPLQRRIDLDTLQIDGAALHLVRDARGRLNLQQLGGAPSPAGAAPAAAVPAPAGAAPWQLSLAALQLSGAQVHWTDATVQPSAALRLDALTLQLRALRWPAPPAMPLSLAATLRPQREGAPAAGQLAVEGQVSMGEARLALKLDDLALDALAPYVAQALRPQLGGRVAAQGRLDWRADPATPALTAALDSVQLRDLTLRDGRTPRDARLASVRQLQISGATLDWIARRLDLGRVQITQPMLALHRQADGQLDLQRWAASTPDARHPAARPAAPTQPVPPWRITLPSLAIDDGRIGWTDAALPGAPATPPLQLAASGLRVRLQGLAWPATARSAPLPLQLTTRVGAVARPGAPADTGRIDWRGRIGLAPLAAQGQLVIDQLPLHLLTPYAGNALPVHIAHADGGFRGQVTARQAAGGWQLRTDGDLQLNGLQVHTRAEAAQDLDGGTELMSWQSLSLQGLQLAMAPSHRPQIGVREATLSDFYSRLVITEQGQFNLREVAAPAAAATAASAPAAPLAASAAGAPADAPLPIDLVVESTRLRDGRIDFTDNFISPHFSARLTGLNGQIGALRSGTREMAPISLHGRVADTALLEITGQLNPTAQPLALDIRARATDLELAPLSPYAGKYAGYAIERGKLSVDLAYKIEADGRLAASNQVVLNQLTFGDKVDSPSATRLPVLLAVALLKDRHGVIDINLPISGSVSDPQFSVGGILWKLVLNLIGKALTAPFALLAGGGGPDLSQVAFVPGTARLADDAAAVIDKVAQALHDRPALTMTVTGSADAAVEREAYVQAALDDRLLVERRRAQLRSGGSAAAADAAASAAALAEAAAAPLAADERGRLLRALYRQTPLPGKPRNLVGLLRDLPEAEMAARLKAAIAVDDDAMRALALQRGLAVRDALAARGLPTARLYVAAPRLHGRGEAGTTGAAADADRPWTPRATLGLALP